MAERAWNLIGGWRTPFARANGALKKTPPLTLVRVVCEETLSRLELDPRSVKLFVLSTVMPEFFPPYAARSLACFLGLSPETPALLFTEGECAPLAFLRRLDGETGPVLLAGGDAASWAMGQNVRGASYLDRIGFRPDGIRSLSEDAEATAEKNGFSRTELDSYAVDSYSRFEEAAEREPLVPVLPPPDYEEFVRHDQKLRSSPTAAQFGSFPAILKTPGSVCTFGTVAMPADGAACCVLAPAGSEELTDRAAARGSSTIKAHILRSFFSGAPEEGSATAFAVKRMLSEAGCTLNDLQELDIFERSAAHILSAFDELGSDARKKVNRTGGALAHGNVPGASFIRQLLQLGRRLKAGRNGIAAVEAGGRCGAVLMEGGRA